MKWFSSVLPLFAQNEDEPIALQPHVSRDTYASELFYSRIYISPSFVNFEY